ncbi:MAG: ankyrin repeat domain-containing protein [Treponema sp.]|nr:ankyrin repeat domain-containing protein [Treponema sp.]
MNNVSSNIRRLRKELNMSQDDIASKLNIARPVISNWERSIGEPSTSQLARLAQILNVSIDILVNNEASGKRVAVIDTSMLIKRPDIIREIMKKFDEIIVPQIVIDELNNQKDNAKPWLKRQAALIMHYIGEIKRENKKLIIQSTLSKNINDKHDVQIANIAIERAGRNFSDKIYVFAVDIWYSFLVNEKRSNLVLLGYDTYKTHFHDNENEYDTEKTQKFMSLLKEKKWEQMQAMEYDPEININYVDPEIGYTPLIQAVRYKNIDIINYLMETYKGRIDLDCHDHYKYKFTPLLHTAQMERLDMMKLLVEEGADIDVGSKGDNKGNTALMVCAWHGFIGGVKFLIEQGACLNQQDNKNGFTALIKACIKGHLDVADLIIKKADVHIRSWENKKAVEYIKPNKKNSLDLYNLFKDRM